LIEDVEQTMDRLGQLQREWEVWLVRIGSVDEWAMEEVSCSRAVFYEVVLNEFKNRIIALQGGIDKDEKYTRKWLVSKVRVFTELFGKGSTQSRQCENLLNHDSNKVREEANKYVSFLRANNEKPTSRFCKLGKDCSTVDDIAQIQKPGGGGL